jgi:hypothetical protein
MLTALVGIQILPWSLTSSPLVPLFVGGTGVRLVQLQRKDFDIQNEDWREPRG